MANMLMMRYAAQRSAESEREPMRRDMPNSAYYAPQQTVKQPVHDDYDGGVESRYRGKDGRWKAGTRRSEYEAEPDYMGDDDERPENVLPFSTPERRENRQIGFAARNRMSAESDDHNEMGTASEKKTEKMTRETAEKWVREMQPEDRRQPNGGKWTPEMIRPIADKYGIPFNSDKFWPFYAVMNAIYSDTSEIAKEYGITNPDYYAKLAMAWLHDRDAVPNKAEMYYKYIVRH